jgi:hypothetical protein
MADSDQSLTVQINTDASGATAGIAGVNAALDALIAKIQATSATGGAMGTELAAGHAVAAGAATEHAAAETILGESLGRVSSATNSAARLFSTLGFDTAEATERVEGLSEAMEGLGKAALPLLAIGATVLAVAEAFNFLKDGVDEAAKAQVAMTSLGVAVTNQGGDWSKAKSGVETFLDAIEKSTTYSRGEALEALNTLTAAGVSLSDSMHLVAVATDVAAGTHRSLTDVVNVLKEAELGRTRGLQQLDEHLVGVIKNHGELSTAVTILANDFSGQATAAANTFQGKTEQLQNSLAHIGEELGERLIPALTVATEVLIGIADAAEDSAPRVEAFFDKVISSVEHASRVFSDLARNAKFAMDIAAGDGAALIQDFKGNADASTDLAHMVGSDLYSTPDPGAGASNPASDWMRQMTAKAARDQTEANKILQGYRQAALQNDAQMGNEPKDAKGKAAPDPESFGQAIDLSGDSSGSGTATAAYKAEDADLKALTSSEDSYREAVKLASTAADEHAAKLALANKETVDATVSVNILKTAIDDEKTQLAAATAEQTRHQEAADAVGKAYNTLLAQVKAAGVETRQQKDDLKELKEAYDLHNKAAGQAGSLVSTLTGEIESNSTALATQTQRLQTNAEAMAAQQRATEAIVDAWDKQLDAAAKSNADEDDRRRTQQNDLATENALYGTSLQYQLNFYRQRYANAVAADDQYSDQAKADFAKIISLEGDEYKERLDAQKAFVEEAQKLETSFLDDVLTKHQSLRDDLKSIFSDIEADFVKMIEQMILKSSLLNGLNSSLEKIFNIGGASSTGGSPGGGGLGGLFGAVGGGSGGTGSSNSIVTGIDTPGQNATVDLGSQTVTALTGSSSGYSGPDMGNAGGGGANWGNASGFTARGAIGGAAEGLAVSGIVSSIFGGNAANASIGGALGGAVGSIGGPLGSAIGSVAGSILGGLFGSKATPATSPDIFDTKNYGQGVANLTGQMAGANGQSFYSNVTSQTGGLGEIGYIEEALAGATKITSGNQAGWYTTAGGETLNPQEYQQLVSAFGISATGSGQLNFGHNIGQQWVTGAQGASTTPTSYSTLDALAASFLSQGGSGSTDASVFTVGRTYPNMNLGTLNADGTYSETANGTTSPAVGKTPTSSTASTVTSGSGVTSDKEVGTPKTNGISLTININGNNTIAGAGNMKAFTEAIAGDVSTALQRYAAGQIPGGIAATARSRTGLV